MSNYIREIKDAGIGAFSAHDEETAWRLTENKYGSDNVIDVREATQEELEHIRRMGGFTPK
jgi:hypothetical protein